MTGHDRTMRALAVRGRPLTDEETRLVDGALDKLIRHEARREATYGRPPYDEDAACQRIHAEAIARGHDACLDPVLAIVLTECPRCHAERHDPQHIYLPLHVVPRSIPGYDGGYIATTFFCTSCDFQRVDVHT